MSECSQRLAAKHVKVYPGIGWRGLGGTEGYTLPYGQEKVLQIKIGVDFWRKWA